MNIKDFSIIILNNNERNLIKCIDSIFKQRYDKNKFEIIVLTEKLEDETLNNIKNYDTNVISIKQVDKLDIADCYNYGLEKSSGTYINFINSDIFMINDKTLELVKNNGKNYNLICCNIEYFDIDSRESKKYILSKNNICEYDIGKQSGEINLCLESYFIKRSVLSGMKFDSTFASECREHMIASIYLRNQIYLNLGNVKLISTIPFEDNFSKYSHQYDVDWYIKSFKNWMHFLRQFEYVPLYIQEIIMYVIYSKYNCNFGDRDKFVLSRDDYKSFEILTKELLQKVSSNIILQNSISSEYRKINHRFKIPRSLRMYFYKLIRGKDYKPILSGTYLLEIYNNNLVPILNIENEKIDVVAINYEKGQLIFDCNACIKDYLDENEIDLKVVYAGHEVKFTKTKIYGLMRIFGQTYNSKYSFQFRIDIKKNWGDLKIFLVYKGKQFLMNFNFIKVQARLNKSKRSFWNYNDFTLENKINKIVVRSRKSLKTFKLELCFILSKLKNEKNKLRVLKLTFLRLLYYFTRPYFKYKHIWITFDKLYKAGDNGEYVYHYGLKQHRNVYYIIKRDSLDFKRLKKENRKHILVYNSIRAKLYSLHSEVILDTHSNAVSYCGFESLARDFVAGLFNAEMICIQHGLTMQDIAQYQNRLFDNIKLYCCASKYEINNISKDIYGFDKNMLKLTGLARFDGLQNSDKRIVLITPTWRRNVVNFSVAHIKKKHNDNFKTSTYFKIYNSLINNAKLIDCAKKNNYKIIYLLHPAMSGQLKDYDKNAFVKIIPATGTMSYEKILTESSLMVTDYSGVQYDFAYMRKPIVYYHPKSLPPHYENGMMDYENMGFGPICTDENEIVDALCKYMEKDCVIDSKYMQRQNNFFEYSDFNNSKRIFEEVDQYLKDRSVL